MRESFLGTHHNTTTIAFIALLLSFFSLNAQAETPNQPSTETPSQSATTDAKNVTLNVTTFGGAYGEAFTQAIVKPFVEQSGLSISPVYHANTDATLASLKEASPTPDVIELDRKSLDVACDAGLLQKTSDSDEADAEEQKASNKKKKENTDYLPGSLHPCGVGSLSWSAVTVYNTKKFKKRQPKSLSHLLNTRRFPGKRAFVAKPEYLFEKILIADGVKPRDVYKILATDKGLKRVLKRLTRLSSHIIWADTPTGALELVETGQAAIGIGFNGRIFIDRARGAPIAILWDGQIYDNNYYAISAQSQNKAQALSFVAFATDTDQLAKHAAQIAYGPLKRSAIAQLNEHPTLGLSLKPFTPTHPKNRKRRLQRNAKWWGENGTRLTEAFDTWLAEQKSKNSR